MNSAELVSGRTGFQTQQAGSGVHIPNPYDLFASLEPSIKLSFLDFQFRGLTSHFRGDLYF